MQTIICQELHLEGFFLSFLFFCFSLCYMTFLSLEHWVKCFSAAVYNHLSKLTGLA